MQYQLDSMNGLLILKLFGGVTTESWYRSFSAAEDCYEAGNHSALLIDGSKLVSFGISHFDCQKLARGFAHFAAKGAFFSSDPLIFGMMRVIHSYSNNETFIVCKSCEQAISYLRDCSADYA